MSVVARSSSNSRQSNRVGSRRSGRCCSGEGPRDRGGSSRPIRERPGAKRRFAAGRRGPRRPAKCPAHSTGCLGKTCVHASATPSRSSIDGIRRHEPCGCGDGAITKGLCSREMCRTQDRRRVTCRSDMGLREVRARLDPMTGQHFRTAGPGAAVPLDRPATAVAGQFRALGSLPASAPALMAATARPAAGSMAPSAAGELGSHSSAGSESTHSCASSAPGAGDAHADPVISRASNLCKWSRFYRHDAPDGSGDRFRVRAVAPALEQSGQCP